MTVEQPQHNRANQHSARLDNYLTELCIYARQASALSLLPIYTSSASGNMPGVCICVSKWHRERFSVEFQLDPSLDRPA